LPAFKQIVLNSPPYTGHSVLPSLIMPRYRHRTMRHQRANASAPALPPLLRLWTAHVTGVPAKFAPHELYRIPQQKRARIVLSDWRNGYPDVSGEGEYQARRSQTENSPDTKMPAERVANLLQRHMLRHCTGCADRSRRVPVAVIARMADVSRETAYQAARARMSETTRIRLSAVLFSIEDGTLDFRRVGQVWEGDYRERREDRTSPLYPTPAPPLPPQDKMVRVVDFVDGARCRSCGGWRYTRVTLHGADAEWYLCDGCLLWETAGLGARPVEGRRRTGTKPRVLNHLNHLSR
jgi:hypothetical protein